MSKLITIVVPCCNEADVLWYFYDQVTKTVQALKNYEFELLFINDGSEDETLNIIKSFLSNDKRVNYIDLSRNFGKEVAMLAGFDNANGDALIIMDADLQHPPEKIPEMIEWWEKGFDDVYTVRLNRKETYLKKLFSKTYYMLLQKITKEHVYPNSGDFRLLDRKCIDALKSMRENERYTKGMYGWIGFKKKELTYHENERIAGNSKWKFSQLFKLALDGITSYSTVPLRLSSILGLIISLFAFVFLIFEIIKILINGPQVAGYATLLSGVLFMGGIQLISLGIIGEYLSRVFIETKNRPVYLVRSSNINVKEEDKHGN